MSKPVLVTGATGKQGGSLINALLADKSNQFQILAVTRDASSASAQKLLAKSESIKLIEGNLDDAAQLFAAAKQAADGKPIWGVYSVQISMGKGVTVEGEIKQGNDLIDESIKNGVQHFVYSSVERGGDERSWENETPINHFQTKYHIEHHLRDEAKKAGDKMGWTILRPVAFMDNLQPGFPSKVFLTALRDTLGPNKKIQYVATADIGIFAAKAFQDPAKWNHRAIGLAGDEFTFEEMSKKFQNATGSPAGTTYSFLGGFLMWAVAELGHMIRWFGAEGYGANLQELRKIHPGLLDFEAWLKQESNFPKA